MTSESFYGFRVLTSAAALTLAACASLPDEDRPILELPRIRIVERERLSAESSCDPVKRTPNNQNVVPVGVTRKEAAALTQSLLLEHFREVGKDLDHEIGSPSSRGCNPSFVGWSIGYDQVFNGVAITQSDSYWYGWRCFGVRGTIYARDDWSISSELADVTAEPDSSGPILSKKEAARLGFAALRVDPDKEHIVQEFRLLYLRGSGPEDERVPAWWIDVRIPVERGHVTSYWGVHTGGHVVLDAWTGAVIAGDPLAKDWPKQDASERRRVAGLDQNHGLSASTIRVLDDLKIGMTEEEVKSRLIPVALAFGRNWGGGTGVYTARWKLNGKKDLCVEYGGSVAPDPLKFKATAFWLDDSTSESWYSLNWEPTPAESRMAFEIAAKDLRGRLIRGEDVEKIHPTGGAGYEVRAPIGVLELGSRRLLATIGSAKWLGPRIIEVNFFQQDRWVCEIAVNIDVGEVVPHHWKPGPDDIAAARKIADSLVEEFLNKDAEGKLEVEAWGKYDYVRNHRLITLCYTRYVGGIGRLQFQTVDVESRCAFKP